MKIHVNFKKTPDRNPGGRKRFWSDFPSKKWVPNNYVRWKEESQSYNAGKEPPDSWGKAVSINSDQTYIPHAGRDPAWPYVSKANSLKLLSLLT